MSEWNKTSTTSIRLKEAMHIRKMKQSDLARSTGLSKGGISNYVTGRYEPKSDIITKLAQSLNVSEMWLWGYDVPMERENKKAVSLKDVKLSEGEQALIELFRRIPEDKQQLVLQMIRVALENQ